MNPGGQVAVWPSEKLLDTELFNAIMEDSPGLTDDDECDYDNRKFLFLAR